jgi:hypothetical protein
MREASSPASNDMAKDIFLGDRNIISLDRSVDLNGVRYLAGDSVTVDSVTARSLIESHYGELVSLEWEKGLKLTGQSVNWRK